MTWQRTEALTSVRTVEDEPRTIVGIAVPYGQIAANTEFGREAFAARAFAGSVDHWMTRQDGARMPLRPEHGARPVGTVTELSDEPDGVHFRASVFEGPDGDRFISEVAAGLNGVSIEFAPVGPSKRTRDGVVVHQAARLMGIAGSLSPAYDGARISLRDEDFILDTELNNTAERDTAEAKVETQHEVAPAERSAKERETVRDIHVSITRAEAIYGPRSGHSYFADALRAREGDGEAAERQSRHAKLLTDQAALYERAGDVMGADLGGALPTEYLPGLLTPRILKGRPMGSFFSRFTISDARPRTFPRVTTSTSAAAQSAEGTNPAASDFSTTAVTATPLLYGGHTLVSRQVLDSADPTIDAMLMQDLTEAYAQASEAAIVTAVEAAAGAGAYINAGAPHDGILDNIVAYQAARFQPAEGVFLPASLYQAALKQKDNSGRPLLPALGPSNSDGQVGSAGVSMLDANVLISWGSSADTVTIARKSDMVIFESQLATFRYEQAHGPAQVDIGVWGYLVCGQRRGAFKTVAS
jgi:HK97 family phage major capsid protein